MAHNVTPLTVEQQLSLRNRAKAELIRLEAVYSDEETKEKINRFKIMDYPDLSEYIREKKSFERIWRSAAI